MKDLATIPTIDAFPTNLLVIGRLSDAEATFPKTYPQETIERAITWAKHECFGAEYCNLVSIDVDARVEVLAEDTNRQIRVAVSCPNSVFRQAVGDEIEKQWIPVLGFVGTLYKGYAAEVPDDFFSREWSGLL